MFQEPTRCVYKASRALRVHQTRHDAFTFSPNPRKHVSLSRFNTSTQTQRGHVTLRLQGCSSRLTDSSPGPNGSKARALKTAQKQPGGHYQPSPLETRGPFHFLL